MYDWIFPKCVLPDDNLNIHKYIISPKFVYKIEIRL